MREKGVLRLRRRSAASAQDDNKKQQILRLVATLRSLRMTIPEVIAEKGPFDFGGKAAFAQDDNRNSRSFDFGGEAAFAQDDIGVDSERFQQLRSKKLRSCGATGPQGLSPLDSGCLQATLVTEVSSRPEDQVKPHGLKSVRRIINKQLIGTAEAVP
jgi:hypothetical protein